MGDILLRAIAGALFLTVGIALFLKQRKNVQNCTASVSAEVTDYCSETKYDSDNVPTEVFYPVMRYCVSGQWYEEKSNVGSSRQKYETGDRVDILYDPKKPENFMIPGDKTNLILAIVFTCVGIGTIVSAFVG